MKGLKSKMGAFKQLAVIPVSGLLLLSLARMQTDAGASTEQSQAQCGWQIFPSPPQTGTMYSLDMLDPAPGWAGGMAGALLGYNGSFWVPGVVPGIDDIISGIDLLSPTSGWGVTNRGRIIRYDGASWQVHSRPVEQWLDDLYMVSETDGWAVGEGGMILRYNGSTWNQAVSPTGSWLDAIDMVHANDGWIVGAGAILRWVGTGWTRLTGDWATVWFHDIDMVNGTDGWAVGLDGAIYHYNGSTWSAVDSPTSSTLYAVQMLAADKGWAMGSNGTILRYNGDSWQTVPSPTTRTLYALSAPSTEDVWAVGRLGTILHYIPCPDLSTSTKTASAHRISAGDQLTYTIGVRNSSDLVAPSVVVTDAIPLHTTYVPDSATTTQGTIQQPDPLVVTVGDVAPGEEATITFQVTADALGLDCWFVVNDALIDMQGTQLTRRVVTAVGDCYGVYLPLAHKGY